MTRYPLRGSSDLPAFVRSLADEDACPEAGLERNQRIVASFLAGGTPYRGLLVVHSLGTGKTLTSAAVLAGNATRKAWVVLPASARDNYDIELGKPAAAAEFRCAGVPRPDVRYLSLNGLTARRMAELEAGVNPFAGCVVVVDECHDLTRSVAAASVSGERNNKTRLYDLLAGAEGCKVVMLSATPLINLPRELACLANLCAGPVLTHHVRWRGAMRTEEVRAAVRALAASDAVVGVKANHAGAALRVAPPGFVAVPDKTALVRGSGSVRRALSNAKKYVGANAEVAVSSGPAFDVAAFDDEFVSPDGEIRSRDALAERLKGLISVYDNAAGRSDHFPSATFETVRVRLSDTQFSMYAAARAAEREVDSKSLEAETDVSLYRSYSRAALNFVFPAKDAVKVYKSDVRARLRAESRSTSTRAVAAAHERAMAANVRRLKSSPVWRDDALLREHSPKFYAILESLGSRPGCAMLYSAFRALEGLGLMAHLLRRRGFRELVVHRDDGRNRRFALVGAGKGPVFILPTLNTDDGADLLRLFNGGDLRPGMTRSAHRLFGPDLDNSRGALVKLVMLGVSGAQGINLKCVRTVHIMEPHWHSTQLDQVAGRAIRMHSHAALPPGERSVDVFTYVACFSPEQRRRSAFGPIARYDKGVTSDEALVEISARKEKVLGGLLSVMREASIDCAVWGKECAR